MVFIFSGGHLGQEKEPLKIIHLTSTDIKSLVLTVTVAFETLEATF